MAKRARHSFSYQEVAKLLLQQKGIHSGVWMLGFEFAYANISAGKDRESARQALAISINAVELIDASEDADQLPGGSIFDAATLNPNIAPAPAPKRRTKARGSADDKAKT